jgi:hypothetical protein
MWGFLQVSSFREKPVCLQQQSEGRDNINRQTHVNQSSLILAR